MPNAAGAASTGTTNGGAAAATMPDEEPGAKLTVVFFECCESPASAGAWEAVELRWRLTGKGVAEDEEWQTAALPLRDFGEVAKMATECKGPLNCEQYIATDEKGREVKIPEGVQYWTRLRAASLPPHCQPEPSIG